MNIGHAFEEVNKYKMITKELKRKSPYFPEVYKHETPKEIFYSTLIRIERKGVWYVLHQLDCFNKNPEGYSGEDIFLSRLMECAYQTQLIYKLSGNEDVDDLQISEKDRITQMLDLLVNGKVTTEDMKRLARRYLH